MHRKNENFMLLILNKFYHGCALLFNTEFNQLIPIFERNRDTNGGKKFYPKIYRFQHHSFGKYRNYFSWKAGYILSAIEKYGFQRVSLYSKRIKHYIDQ
jgi:hypothetical protein